VAETVTTGPASVSARAATPWSLAGRWALTAGLVLAAYRHSLAVLVDGLGGQTPLAYLGLVPLVVLGVCLVRGRPGTGELRLPHRQVDWMVGVPLLAGAELVAWILPERLSYAFWANRVDLLGLPLFVAGLVALLFGARVLHRVRLPIALLVLAWPYPWQRHVDGLLAGTTALSRRGVRLAAARLPAIDSAGGSVFHVGRGAERFTVEVGSACGGANGAVGFLLVGGGIALASRGRAPAKGLWLLAGTVLVLVLNVVRIVAILGVGATAGERAAVEIVHPVLGLVLLGVAAVAMIGLLPRFGLALGGPPRRPGGATSPGRRLTMTALVVVVASSGALGVANDGLARFDPFTDLHGAGTVPALTPARLAETGWRAVPYDRVNWAPQYFGAGATWTRYLLRTRADVTTFLDVTDSKDLSTFSSYGLEACYRYHGYAVVSSRRVHVGAPAAGQAITFRNPTAASRWEIVSWVWPVRGAAPRYERVVLLRTTGDSGTAAGGPRHDLVALARKIVASQVPVTQARARA
jgi:exosortase/archaeosortase family protein